MESSANEVSGLQHLAGRMWRMSRRFGKSLAASRGVRGKSAMLRCLVACALTRLGLPSKSREVTLQFRDLQATIDVSRYEIFSYWKMWHEAAYEAMPQFCGRGDSCIVDVGANVGFYTMRRSLVHKDCRIYSFEPSPSAFSRLKRNIAANGLLNVEAFSWAIGSHSGLVRFDEAQQSIQSRVSADGKIEVTCKTLDDVVRELNIPRIDTLKINTEGHEQSVLEGAKVTLAKVARVVLEAHDDLGKQFFVDRTLQEAGLHLLVKKGNLVYYERDS